MDGEEGEQQAQTTDPNQAGETTPDGDSGGSLEQELDQLDEDRVSHVAADEGEASPGEEAAGETQASAEADTPDETTERSEETAEGTSEDQHSTPQELRWSAEDDPSGSYRDAQGRLHDAESGEYMRGESKEPPEHIKEAASVSDEDAEEFWSDEEGEGAEEATEPDVEPVTFTHETEEGEEEFELLVEDEQTREVIESRFEKANEVEDLQEYESELQEVEKDVEAGRQEIMAVEEGIRQDPSGFILDHLDPDPETLSTLARDILAFNDEAFQEVAQTVRQWRGDRTARKEHRLDRKEALDESRQKREAATNQAVMVRQIGNRVTEDLIPSDLDREDQRSLFDDIWREIEAFADENPEKLGPDMIEEIPGVQRRLRLYGVDPESLSTNGSGGEGGRQNGNSDVTEAKPAGEQEQELMERAEAARRVGVRLRKKRDRKEDAAATSPAGAGPSPSGRDMSGKNLEEALEEIG